MDDGPNFCICDVVSYKVLVPLGFFAENTQKHANF